jgi:predicted metal-dependent hydrolase
MRLRSASQPRFPHPQPVGYLTLKKSDRIAAFVRDLGVSSDPALDVRYRGYFQCFNEGRYYEAHDVLEDLWLQTRDENHLYFKGLIQVAGAFVHLQKQFARPDHPKDGKRLRPAVRLFGLAMKNLGAFRPHHLQFDVELLCRVCEGLAAEIVASDFNRNPWNPNLPPHFDLSPMHPTASS